MTWLHLPTNSRNAACDAVVDLVDGAGAAAGTIEIYKGDHPGVESTPSISDKLATLTFTDPTSTPAFGDAAAGVATAGTITSDSSADSSGIATWARVKNSAGDTIFDCDVGESNATIVLSSTTIVAGTAVSITFASITMPSGA